MLDGTYTAEQAEHAQLRVRGHELLERLGIEHDDTLAALTTDQLRLRVEDLERQVACRTGGLVPSGEDGGEWVEPTESDEHATARLSPATVERLAKLLASGSVSVHLSRQELERTYYGCHVLVFSQRYAASVEQSAMGSAGTLEQAVSASLDVIESMPPVRPFTPVQGAEPRVQFVAERYVRLQDRARARESGGAR